MRRWFVLAALLLAAGCQGSLPKTKGDLAMGYGAILVRGRVVLPSGETYRGRLALNFEGDEKYVVPFLPGRAQLYIVEPGTYRLHPTRGPFGVPEKSLAVGIESHIYRVPFPRDILRKAPVVVKPHKVVSLGILEAVLTREPGARRPSVAVRLDDSPPARRELIEEKIAHMLDPKVPLEARENAVAWTQALDQALVDVQADDGRRPAFKPGR